MKTLSINLSTPCPIYIKHGLLQGPLLAECCKKLNKRIAIITDSHLLNLHGKQLQHYLQQEGLEAVLLAFPAGEAYKTRETKQRLEDELLLKKFGRDTCLLALGGGAVTDLVGFIAASYCRGVPVVYVPTTLLAMVDASIGGKTGVNTPYGKNLIGAFNQPHAVFMDTVFLKTLPEKEWRNGMAEIIKHSVIADAVLFEKLFNFSNEIKQPGFLVEMIYSSCRIKKNIVEQDGTEQGIRQILNFGHTIGHALETVENYTIGHGEAVAIGMLVESHLSRQVGHLHNNTFSALDHILRKYGLPLQTGAFQDKGAFKKLIMLDKKTKQNKAHFVLLEKIGKVHFHNNHYTHEVRAGALRAALAWACEYFS